MRVLARCIAVVAVVVTFQGGIVGAAASSGSAAAATAQQQPATSTSGIEGRVLAGPTCPEARGAQCGDKPYQATIVVKTGAGSREIIRFRSSEHGFFRVSLPPGTYVLVPLSRSRLPRAISQEVRVRRNQFTHIVIRYDTGIR